MIKRQGYRFGAVLVTMMIVAGAARAQGNYRGGHDDVRGGDHRSENWVFLGDRHVDGKADRDNIEVKPEEGTFRAIQFRVDGGLVRFTQVIIHFRDRSHEQLDIRADVRSGERTRAIDLPGRRRSIQSVEMWYGKGNWRTRPTIHLYGLK